MGYIILRQVIFNLLSNALKFTESGYIELGYTLIGESLIFYVKDTGIGIPKDYQKVVFERFRQAERDTNKLYGGTGLGLSISQNLIDMLSGEIWVESKHGLGSCFYVAFLTVMEDKKNENLNNEFNYDWKDKLILVIENDTFIYKYLNDIIKSYNAKIIFVETVEMGLEYISRGNIIDLIILDDIIPDMKGYDRIMDLKLKQIQIPIIIQSAFCSNKFKRTFNTTDNIDFISKPPDVKDLLIKINRILANK